MFGSGTYRVEDMFFSRQNAGWQSRSSQDLVSCDAFVFLPVPCLGRALRNLELLYYNCRDSRFLMYTAFGRIWQHGKYSYRVWQWFAYNSKIFWKWPKLEKQQRQDLDPSRLLFALLPAKAPPSYSYARNILSRLVARPGSWEIGFEKNFPECSP